MSSREMMRLLKRRDLQAKIKFMEQQVSLCQKIEVHVVKNKVDI